MSDPIPKELHPGDVIFRNLTTGKKSRRPVAELPDEVVFFETETGRLPIVRIESIEIGENRVEVRYFGPGKQLLRTELLDETKRQRELGH